MLKWHNSKERVSVLNRIMEDKKIIQGPQPWAVAHHICIKNLKTTFIIALCNIYLFKYQLKFKHIS